MLGRRRSWLLLSQIMVIVSIIGMAMTDAALDPGTIALFAIALALEFCDPRYRRGWLSYRGGGPRRTKGLWPQPTKRDTGWQ